jgi:hypothetical protein
LSEARIRLAIEHPISIRKKVHTHLRNEIPGGRIPPSACMVEPLQLVGYWVKPIKWGEVEEIWDGRSNVMPLKKRPRKARMILMKLVQETRN